MEAFIPTIYTQVDYKMCLIVNIMRLINIYTMCLVLISLRKFARFFGPVLVNDEQAHLPPPPEKEPFSFFYPK